MHIKVCYDTEGKDCESLACQGNCETDSDNYVSVFWDDLTIVNKKKIQSHHTLCHSAWP